MGTTGTRRRRGERVAAKNGRDGDKGGRGRGGRPYTAAAGTKGEEGRQRERVAAKHDRNGDKGGKRGSVAAKDGRDAQISVTFS